MSLIEPARPQSAAEVRELALQTHRRRAALRAGAASAAAPAPAPSSPAPSSPAPAPAPTPLVPARKQPAIYAPAPWPRNPAAITMREIIDATAAYFDVTPNDVISPRRAALFVAARHVAMYLAGRLAPRSLPAIGRSFSRDHATVLHAHRRIAAERGNGNDFINTAIREIAAVFGMSVPDEKSRPFVPRRFPRWSGADDSRLHQMVAAKFSDDEMARNLGRSVQAIRIRITKLKLRPVRYREWTPEEVDLLKKMMARGAPYLEMQMALQRRYESIRRKITYLDLEASA